MERAAKYSDHNHAFAPRCLQHGLFGVVLLLAVWMIPAPATAQTVDDAIRFSRQLPGAGARMTGMAGAGIGGVGDFSALVTNPAGLGYLPASQVVGSFAILRVRDQARYESPAVGDEPPNVSTTTEYLTDYGLGSLGLAYKVPTAQGTLVLAGGLNRTGTFERSLSYEGLNSANSITDTFLPFPGNYRVADNGDLVFDFTLPLRAFEAGAIEFLPDEFDAGNYPFIQAVAPGTTIQQQGDVLEEGGITELNVGGAVEAAPGVMAGLSLNAAFGSYRFSRFYREIDINDENTPALYEVVVDNGVLRGFDEVDVEEGIDSDLAGVSVRGGVTAEITPTVRAGITLETPTWYAINETFGTRITTFFDSGGSLASGQTDANEFDYNVRTPWRFGAGLVARISQLRLLGDVEFVDWSQLQVTADDANYDDLNRALNDLNAVINLHLGAEYDFGELTVRGGYAHQPDPRETEIQLPDGKTTDQTKTFFSLGVSYAFSPQFRLDVSWMQERFDDQYRPYPSTEVPGEVGPNGEPVTIIAPYIDEELVRNRVLIGLSYLF